MDKASVSREAKIYVPESMQMVHGPRFQPSRCESSELPIERHDVANQKSYFAMFWWSLSTHKYNSQSSAQWSRFEYRKGMREKTGKRRERSEVSYCSTRLHEVGAQPNHICWNRDTNLTVRRCEDLHIDYTLVREGVSVQHTSGTHRPDLQV